MIMATDKQRKLADLISENLRKNCKNVRPMGEMMVEAGYSKSVSESPSIVTRSAAFLKILEEAGITDTKLATTLTNGLKAKFGKYADHPVRHKFMMTALELKGLISRKGFSLHVGDKNTQINAGRIMIVRPADHKPMDTVDVEGEAEDG